MAEPPDTGIVEEHCRERGKRGFGVYDHGDCIWYSEWPSDDVTPDKIVMLEQYLETRRRTQIQVMPASV